MVRSVTTFDPDWDDADIASALAWVEDEEARCSGCGLHRDETFDPDHGGNYYDAEPFQCHACAARDRAQTAYRENNGDTAGIYWRLRDRG